MNKLTFFDGNDKKVYVRWSLNERIQHWIMAVSFIFLVITGFALKYPAAWGVRQFGGIEWLFDLRGLMHRIAGSIFILLGFYHAWYMIATRRGRNLIAAFIPKFQDLRDASLNISYNFGLSKQPPKFKHFSYMEKAEYLALIWGAIIMGISGIMLWFDGLTMQFLPKWTIDLLTVIHLYEAWLATLAIIVWHFYYIIINPDIYPLNTSMIDGKITEKEFRDEYYLEWLEMQENNTENELQKHLN